MDLKRFPFYQRLVSLGLVRVTRHDGTMWWVGPRAAKEMEESGEAVVVKRFTQQQAKEMDEAE